MTKHERYLILLDFVKKLAKQEKYNDKQLNFILCNTDEDSSAYVEAWIMIKAREILNEIN